MDHRVVEWVMQHRIFIGVVLLALGLAASGLLAFAASSDDPPDGAQSALLVFIGSLFNVGGVWAMSGRPGGPNLTASRMTARHLADITDGVSALKGLAEKAFDSRTPEQGREDIGEISWKLSAVETRLITNLEDWARAYPDLVEGKDGEPEEE